MRVFIGVDFCKKAKLSIYERTDLFKENQHGHRVPCENYHLTLKYIGEVNGETLDRFINYFKTFKLPQHAFEVTFDGIDIFESSKSKPVFLKPQTAPKALNELYQRIENETVAFGFKPLVQTFRPHITLARKVKQCFQFPIAVEPLIIPIDNVTLFESKRVNGLLRYIPVVKKRLEECV